MSSLLSFPIDLPRLDLAEADLLFDVVKDHQKVHFNVYPESLLVIVTTALLSSMMIAGDQRVF
jgi:hypothetical protein